MFRKGPKLSKMDGQVLASLRAQGADLSKTHLIEHIIVFKTRAEAEMAAVALSKMGMQTRLEEHIEGYPWALAAAHHLVPTDAAIADIVARMEGFARAAGAGYDGWSTMPVK